MPPRRVCWSRRVGGSPSGARTLPPQAAFAEINDVAIDMGGTVTGEHGVGILKLDGMRRELGPIAVAVQRAVKDALDPLGILNPGKVVGKPGGHAPESSLTG
jgi:FAD/FMN-containing dehydrogenase